MYQEDGQQKLTKLEVSYNGITPFESTAETYFTPLCSILNPQTTEVSSLVPHLCPAEGKRGLLPPLPLRFLVLWLSRSRRSFPCSSRRLPVEGKAGVLNRSCRETNCSVTSMRSTRCPFTICSRGFVVIVGPQGQVCVIGVEEGLRRSSLGKVEGWVVSSGVLSRVGERNWNVSHRGRMTFRRGPGWGWRTTRIV